VSLGEDDEDGEARSRLEAEAMSGMDLVRDAAETLHRSANAEHNSYLWLCEAVRRDAWCVAKAASVCYGVRTEGYHRALLDIIVDNQGVDWIQKEMDRVRVEKIKEEKERKIAEEKEKKKHEEIQFRHKQRLRRIELSMFGRDGIRVANELEGIEMWERQNEERRQCQLLKGEEKKVHDKKIQKYHDNFYVSRM
jgi:hypothetical protein